MNILKKYPNFNKKMLIYVFIFCIFGIGGITWFAGDSFFISRSNGDVQVALSDGTSFSQRLLGNDYSIQEMTIDILKKDISDDAVLDVYLVQKNDGFENCNILAKETFSADCIKNSNQLVFCFPDIKLLYNRDYYIDFKFSDSVPNKVIYLAGNTDLSDLYTIEGQNYGVGLDFDIKFFTHHSKLFFLWKMCLLFGTLIIALCKINKVYFWEAAGVVCSGSIFCLYFFGILGKLKWGYYSLILVSAISLIYIVWFVFRHDYETITGFWKNYMHHGVWGCILIVFLWLLVDSGKIIQFRDEMTHWATAARDMYWFDSFGLHKDSTVILFRYPPSYTIFQYLFLQLYAKFSPGILNFSKHFLESVLIFSCLDKGKKNSYANIAFVILCIGLPELFFKDYVLSSLYNDVTIGIMFGYVLIRFKKVLDECSVYHIISLALAVMSFVLMKDSALVIALAMLAALFCLIIFDTIYKKYSFRSWMPAFGIVACVSIISELSWHIYLRMNAICIAAESSSSNPVLNANVNTLSASGMDKNRICDYFLGKGEEYQYDIILKHIKKLLFMSDYNNRFIPLSYIGWMIIICVLFWVIMKHIGKDQLYKKELLFIILMSVGVVVAFHILYTFTFSEKEARVFAQEDRYLGAFLIGVVLYGLYILTDAAAKKSQLLYSKGILAFSIVVLLLTSVCQNYRLWALEGPKEKGHSDWRTYQQSLIMRSLIKETDKIYYVSKNDDGDFYWCYRYYLMPASLSNTGKKYYPVIKEDPDEFEYCISIDDWKKVLSEYDYLFVNFCDEDFVSNYGSLFEDPNDIGNGGLYRINSDNSYILSKFVTIESVE